MQTPKLAPRFLGLLISFFSAISWASSSPINDIEMLNNGSMLLATTKGLERFDTTSTSLQANLFKLGMSERLIRRVKRVGSTIYLATNSGLYVQQKNQLTLYLKGLIITDLIIPNAQLVIVATPKGIVEINPSIGTEKWINKEINAQKLAMIDHRLLIGTPNGLYVGLPDKNIFKRFLEDLYIWDIAVNGTDVIVLTNRYTYRLTNHNQLQRIDADGDPAFQRAVIDADRNIIWLASYDGALYLRTLKAFAPIEHVVQRKLEKMNSLAIDSVGNLFVGTKKGLEQYSPPIIRTLPDTQGVHYTTASKGHEFLCTPQSARHNGILIRTLKNFLESNRIMGCHGQNGFLYMATYKGLLRYDPLRHEAWNMPLALAQKTILSISKGRQENSLLVGTVQDGLVEITEDGDIIHHYGSGYNLVGLVADDTIYTVENKFLLKFSGKNLTQKIDLSEYLFSKVADITRHDQTLYLATFGDGILSVNLATGVIRQFDETAGLPDNITQSIITDPQGHIWVGTYNGLAVFDGQRFTAVGDPIEYSLGGLQLLADGSIQSGSEHGITVWDPVEVIAYLEQNPQPFIAQLQVGAQTIFDPSSITLDYDSEQVQLRAMVTQLLSSGLPLEYKIEGHHLDFQTLGANALFSLPRDLHGDYALLLRIKGRPQSEVFYPLAISTPWYFNPLNIVGAVLGLLGMGHQGTRRYVVAKKQHYQSYVQQIAKALAVVSKERIDNRVMFARVLGKGIGEAMDKIVHQWPPARPDSPGAAAFAPFTDTKTELDSLRTHVQTLEQLYYPATLAQKGLYAALKEDVAIRQKMGYDATVLAQSLHLNDRLSTHQRLTVYLCLLELIEYFHEALQPVCINISNSDYMTVLSLPIGTDRFDSWLHYGWSPKLWAVTFDIDLHQETLLIRIIPDQASNMATA